MSDMNDPQFGSQAPSASGAPAGEVWASSIVDGRAAAFDKASRAGTAVLAVLDRAMPVLRQIVRGVRFFAWSGIAAALMIVLSFVIVSWVPDSGQLVFLVVLGAILAIPGLLLLLFHGAVVEALALPDWLRSSPDLARTHAGELSRLARVSAGDATTPRQGGFIGNFFKGGKLLLEARGDFPEYGKTIRLISVPFLFAVGFSLIAVIVLWVVAIMALLAAVFSALL